MKNNPHPLEAEEAQALMKYMRYKGLKFTHIKNETGRADSNGKVRNYKAMWDAKDGVSPGFPDFCIVLPYIGLLFIELKRVAGSEVSEHQKSWVTALNTCPGVECHVAKGADASIAIIKELLQNGSPTPLMRGGAPLPTPVDDSDDLF